MSDMKGLSFQPMMGCDERVAHVEWPEQSSFDLWGGGWDLNPCSRAGRSIITNLVSWSPCVALLWNHLHHNRIVTERCPGVESSAVTPDPSAFGRLNQGRFTLNHQSSKVEDSIFPAFIHIDFKSNSRILRNIPVPLSWGLTSDEYLILIIGIVYLDAMRVPVSVDRTDSSKCTSLQQLLLLLAE